MCLEKRRKGHFSNLDWTFIWGEVLPSSALCWTCTGPAPRALANEDRSGLDDEEYDKKQGYWDLRSHVSDRAYGPSLHGESHVNLSGTDSQGPATYTLENKMALRISERNRRCVMAPGGILSIVKDRIGYWTEASFVCPRSVFWIYL